MGDQAHEYEVGTVIYVIDAKEKSVIPVRINEQIVTRNLGGSSTTHNVEFPNGKLVVLEKLDILHFVGLDEVRSYLMGRAEQVIDNGINQARRLAEKEFGGVSEPGPEKHGTLIDEKVQVTLPDGKIANVKINIPEEFLDENTSS